MNTKKSPIPGLRHLREKEGWSISRLYVMSGVPKSTISMVESGKMGVPRMKTLEALASALGVRISDLFLPPES